MIKILGTDDAVNTCDCCGKSNLKSTVIVDVAGEILHYGSVCATRHTGLNSKEINAAIKSHSDGIAAQAKKEFENSPEYLAEQGAIYSARRANIRPGKEFGDYTRPYTQAANVAKRAVAQKYNVEPCKF